MSTSLSAAARRSFRSGSRLWPPAMTFAPPPTAATASASDDARVYSNAAGFMRWPPFADCSARHTVWG